MPSPWLVWQLADSAFPTGTFAHSYGLEAAWQSGEVPNREALVGFAQAALLQAGYGVLPLVNAAFRTPERLDELDALAEAFLLNPVANRASRIQGRSLVATCARVWPSPGLATLEGRVRSLRAHVAPLTGVTLREVGAPLWAIQQLVCFTTVRGVASAAVRLGITGSYDAQRLQHELAADIDSLLLRCGTFDEHDLSQPAPVQDIIQAGHDRLYSRLFQS